MISYLMKCQTIRPPQLIRLGFRLRYRKFYRKKFTAGFPQALRIIFFLYNFAEISQKFQKRELSS